MSDTNREFERYMSDLGEAANPAGDGVYQSPRVRRRFDDFRAGFEAASALASRPAEVNERTPRPIATAPHDGTEVLAWSITGKTWHQIYWKTQENGDWLWEKPFPPRWACRWNSEYYQGQNEFSHWLPIPGAPSQTTNKEK